MIATVTMNPAVDYTVTITEPLKKNAVNRAKDELVTAGGKGINISMILSQLGVPTKAYGYLAGTTGTMIADRMRRTQIPTDWNLIENQMTRINLKIREDGAVTELNGSGVTITEKDAQSLISKLRVYGKKDIIVLAGSVPARAPKTHYAELMEALSENGARFAVDTEGEALLETLARHPFVIKPNLTELRGLFSEPIETWWDALPYGKRLIDMGAQNVLLSLGGDGALLFSEEKRVWHLSAPRGEVKNAVGAGDSMLGGFLAACSRGQPLTEALRLGIAAGSATAFTEWVAHRSQIDAILKSLPQPTELV